MTKVTRHGLGGDVSYYSFDNNCVSPMDNLECAVEAVQDLHGYSKPWSGGGGKNKFNDTTGTHTINANTDVILVIGDVYLEANTTYTISCKQTPAPLTSFVRNTLFVVGGGTTTYNPAGNDYTIKPMVFTPTVSGTYSVRVWGHTLSANTTYSQFQVEKGSTATAYEPYSNICPISGFSSCTITVADSDDTPVNTCTVSFGQDVYGGVADVTGGKATLTHAIVDLGTLSWTPYINTFYAQLNNAKSPSSASTVADIICSQYEADTLNHVLGKTTDGIIAINDQQSRVHIYDSTKSSMTGADFKTAMSGVQLVYELATPIEITFTPATTDTINGTNKVSSSTGNMKSLTYFSDVNSDLVDLIRACMI